MFDIWKETTDIHGTQLVFCDLSTPKNDGTFSVYNSIRDKLLEKGIPENEIAFIHNADTEVKKKDLFSKVRKGDVRILLGSTSKMGAQTICKPCSMPRMTLIVRGVRQIWSSALEELSDREIQTKRYIFTAMLPKVTLTHICGRRLSKSRNLSRRDLTSKSPVRVADDIDPTALSYAEIKALSTGNPYIKEKMRTDTEVSKLKLIKSSFMSQIYDLEDKVVKFYPKQIAETIARIKGLEIDIQTVKKYPKIEDKFHTMTIDGFGYFEKEEGNALIERCKKMTSEEPVLIGDYRGFSMELSFDGFQKNFYVSLVGARSYKVELGTDVFGNIQRIDNALEGLEKRLETAKAELENINTQYETAKVEAKRPFPQNADSGENERSCRR